jgi:hypothetical protein
MRPSRPDNAVRQLQADVDRLDRKTSDYDQLLGRMLGKVATLGGRPGKGVDTATPEELLEAAFAGTDAVREKVRAAVTTANTAANSAAGIATLRRKVDACCRHVATAVGSRPPPSAAPTAPVVAPAAAVQTDLSAPAHPPPPASQARPPRCLKCGRRGHRARDCQQPRCYECNQYGHLANECRAPRGPRRHLQASVQQQQRPNINSTSSPTIRAGGINNHPDANITNISTVNAGRPQEPWVAARPGLGNGHGSRTPARWIAFG